MTPRCDLPARFAFAATALVTLALFTGGCGSTESKATTTATASTTATTATDPTDSAYCKTARNWAVHELGGNGDTIMSDPAALKRYWGEYLAFAATAMRQAPAQLRHDWTVKEDFPEHHLTPLFEKYDFDVARIRKQGSAAEKAVAAAGPNAEQSRAQVAVQSYEHRVCGTGQPDAADVSFKGVKVSKPYCNAVQAFDNSTGEHVFAKRVTADAFRKYLTSGTYPRLLAAEEKTAPPEIKADVEAVAEWTRTRWIDVVKKFDYDIGKLLIHGSAADRAIFQDGDPEVAEHYARTAAYEQQLCGA